MADAAQNPDGQAFSTDRDMESVQLSPTGFVYFIQAEHGGPVKIGFARNVKRRLTSLQLGCPYHLVVRRVLDGTERTEKHLHQVFAADRLHGEWFEPSEGICALGDALPDQPLGKVERRASRAGGVRTGEEPRNPPWWLRNGDPVRESDRCHYEKYVQTMKKHRAEQQAREEERIRKLVA